MVYVWKNPNTSVNTSHSSKETNSDVQQILEYVEVTVRQCTLKQQGINSQRVKTEKVTYNISAFPNCEYAQERLGSCVKDRQTAKLIC